MLSAGELPTVQIYDFQEEPEGEGILMEFRLMYEGPLHAETGSRPHVAEKHAIRKCFHPQLKELWNQLPLCRQKEQKYEFADGTTSFHDHIANRYQRCGYNFVPLVSQSTGADCCELNILFLRRDNPGSIVTSGGDIDNRIKVLFDALRMPTESSQLPKGCETPSSEEKPFYCLLEDDSLITTVRVETDRLLRPVTDGGKLHDVVLVVSVKTRMSGYGRLGEEELCS